VWAPQPVSNTTRGASNACSLLICTNLNLENCQIHFRGTKFGYSRSDSFVIFVAYFIDGSLRTRFKATEYLDVGSRPDTGCRQTLNPLLDLRFPYI